MIGKVASNSCFVASFGVGPHPGEPFCSSYGGTLYGGTSVDAILDRQETLTKSVRVHEGCVILVTRKYL